MQTGVCQLVLRPILAAGVFFADRRYIVVTGNGCQKHRPGHGVDRGQHVHVTAAAFREAIPGIHTGDQYREGVLRDVIHGICRGLVFRLVGIGVHNLRIRAEVFELLVLQVRDVPAIGIVQDNSRHLLVIQAVHHSLNVVILLVLERHTFAGKILNQCLGARQGDALQRTHRLALQILLRSDPAVLQRNHLHRCRGFIPEIRHVSQKPRGLGNIVGSCSIHQDHHDSDRGQDDFRSRAPGESQLQDHDQRRNDQNDHTADHEHVFRQHSQFHDLPNQESRQQQHDRRQDPGCGFEGFVGCCLCFSHVAFPPVSFFRPNSARFLRRLSCSLRFCAAVISVWSTSSVFTRRSRARTQTFRSRSARNP